MNRIVVTSIVGAATAAALTLGTCVPAFASTSTPAPKTPRTLASVQAKAATATSDREAKLTAAIAKLTAAKGMNSGDQATLLGRLNADLAGMKSTEAKIAADTTLAAATADFKTVFTTYRVYAVAIPQARIVAAVERATSLGLPRLTAQQTKLAGLLAGKDSGKSTPALQADLTDMQTQIAFATSALNGVAAEALAITPADFNASHSVVSSIRTSVKAAIADVRKAQADRKAIVSALR